MFNVTGKIPQPLDKSKAREVVRNYSLWQTEIIDSSDVLRASEIEEANQMSFWDALIVRAALVSGCVRLYSEDLQHGWRIEKLEVVNPFR